MRRRGLEALWRRACRRWYRSDRRCRSSSLLYGASSSGLRDEGRGGQRQSEACMAGPSPLSLGSSVKRSPAAPIRLEVSQWLEAQLPRGLLEDQGPLLHQNTGFLEVGGRASLRGQTPMLSHPSRECLALSHLLSARCRISGLAAHQLPTGSGPTW